MRSVLHQIKHMCDSLRYLPHSKILFDYYLLKKNTLPNVKVATGIYVTTPTPFCYILTNKKI